MLEPFARAPDHSASSEDQPCEAEIINQYTLILQMNGISRRLVTNIIRGPVIAEPPT
jgi:hypothetical protein